MTCGYFVGGENRVTIKKRLIISNILMIAIPAIVSIIVAALGFLFLYMVFNDAMLEWMAAEREMQGSLAIAAYEGLLVSLTVIGLAILVLLVNRFLLKFVFKKIEQPLAMLSNGVHEISAGNLDYRIVYSQTDEFRQVCDDFNIMAERLRASIEEVRKNERHRKELVSSISHDLRSPLTSIKAFVEGLQDGVAATPEAQREYLAVIYQKTDDIISMVSQLFMYSKMDMGNYPASPERLDIGKELADFIAASREEYRAHGLLIEMAELPAESYVFADPVQLRSVFSNILSNSAKYKYRELAAATIRCLSQDGLIRILFEDDGPGVPEDMLPHLFEAFYRGDPSRSNPHQGSGLGLAIADKAIARMNGRIFAENIEPPQKACGLSGDPGGGLRVVIEIPAMEGEPS